MKTQPQIQTGAVVGPQGNYYDQGVSTPPNGGAVTSVDTPRSENQMIPMFAPDGTLGSIPANRAQEAIKAGAKPAFEMSAPDGSTGYVPGDRVHDAVLAGGKLTSPTGPSMWDLYKQALFNPVGSGAASGVAGGLEQIGGRAMQGILAPVAHPISTLEGIGNLIAHPVNAAEQRIDEFKNEFEKNPALALENAAGDVVGAVEGGRLGSAALSKAADVAAPVVGRAVLLGKTPKDAYESALKPSTTLSPSERANIVQTGLQKGIPVSKAGVEKINDLVDNLNQKIADVIDTDPTRPIDPNAVAARAGHVVPKFQNQVNASGDLNAIADSRQQFLNEQGARPGTPAVLPQPTGLVDAQRRPIMNAGTPATPPTPAPPMAASKAQLMKQGTYRVLRGKYGEQGSAAVEAQKALARGLKEEIATQFPEITKLNADESRLLDLQPVLERAVNRISNHQLIGIGTPVAGAAAKAVTGSRPIGAVVATLKAVLDNPMVKSRLAIAVSKGAKIPYAQAAAKVAAYSAAIGAASANNSQASQ